MGVDNAISVARLVSELGGVTGRKRLQKLVHLLQASGARDFPQRFTLHYFGPFSRELVHDLEVAVSSELAKEAQPAFEEDGYAYSVSESARQRIDQLLGTKPSWRARAHRLNAETTPFLEAASTLVFLAQRGTLPDQLKDRFRKLKPHLVYLFARARDFAKREGLLAENS